MVLWAPAGRWLSGAVTSMNSDQGVGMKATTKVKAQGHQAAEEVG